MCWSVGIWKLSIGSATTTPTLSKYIFERSKTVLCTDCVLSEAARAILHVTGQLVDVWVAAWSHLTIISVHLSPVHSPHWTHSEMEQKEGEEALSVFAGLCKV